MDESASSVASSVADSWPIATADAAKAARMLSKPGTREARRPFDSAYIMILSLGMCSTMGTLGEQICRIRTNGTDIAFVSIGYVSEVVAG
jgi:hypothetical protein